MKPKTKIQIEVDHLSKSLSPIIKSSLPWARKNLFKKYAYKTKHEVICLECGHKWPNSDVKGSLLVKVGGFTCPKCGCDLKVLEGRIRHKFDKEYYFYMSTHKNYQIVRIVWIHQRCYAGKKAVYSSMEVIQHWIREDGLSVVRAVKDNAFGYGDKWIWGSDMEIRNIKDKYYTYGKDICPGKRYLKTLRRNGFKYSFHQLHPAYLFSIILSESKTETLIKTGQFNLLSEYHRYNQKIKEYWPQIRICIRNNYLVKDVATWLDQIDMLISFEKDIYNPKFICPVDLKLEHQRYIRKSNERRRKEGIAKLKAKIAEANILYQQSKSKFFPLQFSNDNFSVVVLKDVNEFVIEGDSLNHCVFSNEYYADEDSLILSARKDNQRLETIEFSLSEMKVVQARGLNNDDSPYHKEIVRLVNSNKKVIKQLAKTI